MGRIAFVVGASRSGTTLLRAMLAGHPGVFAPPELRLAPYPTMTARAVLIGAHPWEGEGLIRALMALLTCDLAAAKEAAAAFDGWDTDAVYEWILERIGDRLLIDKDPRLAYDAAALSRVRDRWPDAVFVRIVRHPISTLRSMRSMRRAELQFAGARPNAVWTEAQRVQDAFFAGLSPERRLSVRFENLVTDPRGVMTGVCTALGLPFDEAVLDPYDGERMIDGPSGARALGDTHLRRRGRIEPSLAEAWRAGIEPEALTADLREVAQGLGYDLRGAPTTVASDAAHALAELFDELRVRAMAIADADDGGDGAVHLVRLVGDALAGIDGPAAIGRTRRRVVGAIDAAADAWKTGGVALHERFGPSDRWFPVSGGRSYAAFWRFDADERWVVRGEAPAEATIATVDRWMRPIAERAVGPGAFAVALSRVDAGDVAWLDPGAGAAGWLVIRGPRDLVAPTIAVERVR